MAYHVAVTARMSTRFLFSHTYSSFLRFVVLPCIGVLVYGLDFYILFLIAGGMLMWRRMGGKGSCRGRS